MSNMTDITKAGNNDQSLGTKTINEQFTTQLKIHGTGALLQAHAKNKNLGPPELIPALVDAETFFDSNGRSVKTTNPNDVKSWGQQFYKRGGGEGVGFAKGDGFAFTNAMNSVIKSFCLGNDFAIHFAHGIYRISKYVPSLTMLQKVEKLKNNSPQGSCFFCEKLSKEDCVCKTSWV